MAAAGESVPALLAIHVHHGISDRADQWQQHCEAFCRTLDIPIICKRVEIESSARHGPEAAARKARYAAIANLRQAGDTLLLGHHCDDQLETVLFRMFRATGISGLGAMRVNSRGGSVCRPLLHVHRSDILAYARAQKLSWVEDDSNANLELSRNFIRHRLVPVITEHWPDYGARLLTLNVAAQRNDQLLAEVASVDLEKLAHSDCWGSYLDLPSLRSLSPSRVANTLTHWLHGCGYSALRQRQWQGFSDKFLGPTMDKLAAIELEGASLRRHRDALYLVPSLESPLAPELPDKGGEAKLGSAGSIALTAVDGEGLAAGRNYRIAYRRGGERVRGAGWGCSKSLKQYLQECGVPPWWRDRTPLLYRGQELAAVADLCICEGAQPVTGEPALRVQWQTGTMYTGAQSC